MLNLVVRKENERLLNVNLVNYYDYTEMRFVLLTQYCAGDKIEKNEMGWACGACG